MEGLLLHRYGLYYSHVPKGLTPPMDRRELVRDVRYMYPRLTVKLLSN